MLSAFNKIHSPFFAAIKLSHDGVKLCAEVTEMVAWPAEVTRHISLLTSKDVAKAMIP